MRRFFILLFFFTSLSIHNAYAEILSDVKIYGNKRISKETIMIFGNIKLNDDINTADLDDILKKLYQTNFFF